MKDIDISSMMENMNVLIEKAKKYDEYVEAQGSIERLKSKSERFYCKALTADFVAKYHDVSKPTVLKYVKLGLIPTHPNSKDGRILIRASDNITLDFFELQHKSKYL